MYYLNPDNKPLALGCWTRFFHYPARIGDRNPSDFFRVFASNYSRESVASQCDKPIKAQMEAIKTAITSNTDTTPSYNMTNTGPTTSAILRNTTNQANGCAKLMVHPSTDDDEERSREDLQRIDTRCPNCSDWPRADHALCDSRQSFL